MRYEEVNIMAIFKRDLAAAVLLEALFSTDEKACKKYGITQRTLHNYRQRLAEDSDFSAFFHTKKELFDKAWADELPVAMREATKAIATISKNILEDPQMKANPFALEKLAGALKLCADVYYTGKVIDARLAKPDRPADSIFGQDDSAGESGEDRPN